MKDVSLPLSLKGSIASSLYFLVKKTTLVFNGFKVRHLVYHQLCTIFKVLIIRSLRILEKFPLTSIAVSPV